MPWPVATRYPAPAIPSREADTGTEAEEERTRSAERTRQGGQPKARIQRMEKQGNRDGDRRSVDDPDRESFEPVSDHGQRPSEGQGHRDCPPRRHEDHRGPWAEKIRRDDGGGLGHHQELKGRPPEELHDV